MDGIAPVLLAVCSDPKDREFVEVSLKSWRVYGAGTCREALSTLREMDCDVVLCEHNLPDGCWRDVLTGLGTLTAALPVVVMSGAADESMWAEVLREGGFDLLAKPLKDTEICRVLPNAHAHSAHGHVLSTHA